MNLRLAIRRLSLAILGAGLTASTVLAQDGVARVSAYSQQAATWHPAVAGRAMAGQQVSHTASSGYNSDCNCYSQTVGQSWNNAYNGQQPNPTYWTFMPCPFQCNNGCYDGCNYGQKGVWTFPAVRWLLDPNYYAVAPDYGWSPPAKRAIERQNVTYQHYRPQYWYGQNRPMGESGMSGPAAPIVHTPTDTTQLGYSYQHVPTWQPAAMLPRPPHPRYWHVRPCMPDADFGYYVWMPLDRIQQLQQSGQLTPITNGSQMTPTPDSGPAELAPVPNTEDAPANPVPAPEAINDPEISTGIRRATYRP